MPADDTTAKLLAGQSELSAEVRGLREKVVDAVNGVHGQTKTLFEHRDVHAEKISRIESTYVDRQRFEQHETSQRQDTRRLFEKFDALNTSVTRILAVAGVGLIVLQGFLSIVGKWM